MQDEYKDLQKRLMMYQNKMLRQKSRHLDYIEKLPEGVHREAVNSVRRENVFKNVVFQRLLEIREEKRKPKLGEILTLINKSFKGGTVNKDFVINKIKLLYAVDGEDKP